MLGSAFSPYYALSRSRGAGDPLNHCVLNVAIYDGRAKRWAMTERGRRSVSRDSAWLTIGPSALSWDGTALRVEIDEIAVPLPSRIRGQVRIHPSALADSSVALDRDGRHWWTPIAPCARIEVMLDEPDIHWSGSGYLDGNFGDEPLEKAFKHWSWSRAGMRSGTAVLYDIERRNGPDLSLAMRFDQAGGMSDFAPPPPVSMPRTRWRMSRDTRADAGHETTLVRTLEDGPFYARSIFSTQLLAEPVTMVHESLSLDRAASLSTRLMIPFRNPRAPW